MPRATTKKPSRVHQATLSELAEADITPEERFEMIAEAAYYRAQKRGFEGDEHLQDWLEAEKLIDSQLRQSAAGPLELIH